MYSSDLKKPEANQESLLAALLAYENRSARLIAYTQADPDKSNAIVHHVNPSMLVNRDHTGNM
jgi:hypothetical protein